jgi:rhodanese-related sulfurtransferase
MDRRSWLLASTLASILASLAPTAALLGQNKPSVEEKKLTADELKELLAKQDVFFLDVREPKELEEMGTIKGYVNIPLGQLESRMSEVPKDKPIITACQRGVRAGRAAALLNKNGYKVIGSCGLTEWKEKNYPLIYPKQK